MIENEQRPLLCSSDDLIAAVEKYGFLPFFRNEIPSFSVEELCTPELWLADDADGPWEWKGPAARSGRCLYGKIQSTEASNAIEGIVTTSTRIRQLVEEKTTPRNRDEQEIAGYRDVLSIIHESFDAIPITQHYILQLHKILYSHMNNPLAGRTKSVQNYITATYPDGHVETLFTPLAPYETPEALDRICEEYNRVIGNMELEPLITIPVFIHDFLCIHPFNDGNGRMSRLLTTLLLYRNGFYVGKYISLEAKIAKNKDL